MIHNSLPLFYPLLALIFRSADMNRVIITFGQGIYSRQRIPPALVVHESVHCKQQKNSRIYGIYWWIRYLTSKKFRLSQEVAAYRAQYQWVCKNEKRNKQWWLDNMVRDLSTCYNLDLTIKQAKELII